MKMIDNAGERKGDEFGGYEAGDQEVDSWIDLGCGIGKDVGYYKDEIEEEANWGHSWKHPDCSWGEIGSGDV